MCPLFGGKVTVVSDMRKLDSLVESYLQGKFKHELVRHDDYVRSPKVSGYRSVHLIYRYRGEHPSAAPYNGLLVEVQMRTQIQHAWAAAVETMGTFLNQALKGSEGPEPWLRFFSLTSSAFAHLEGTPPQPEFAHLNVKETFKEVEKQAYALGVREKLAAFSVAMEHINKDEGSGSFHLITLDPGRKKVWIESFSQDRLDEANAAYAKVEKRALEEKSLQAVLVRTSSVEHLRRAYPSYFLDTKSFIQQLDRMVRLSNQPLQRTRSARS